MKMNGDGGGNGDYQAVDRITTHVKSFGNARSKVEHGDEQSVNLWNDKLVGSSSLRSFIHGPLPHDEEIRKASSIISSSREWKLDSLPFVLGSSVTAAIRGIPLSSTISDCDRVVWGMSHSAEFTLKSAYNLLSTQHLSMLGPYWRWIWKSLSPPKIQNW
ncbi:hypothetical protein CRG98_046082 [Punica granatum]|uniref:Uncharacterized protein n=1 Tax=Punica granatum TaxID=22663 RepID=A0A2I0HQH2_PUNGR|nr:hypothetical protein CRG98_046082 [Punica granatum]